jgi:hypothetical protein
MRDPAVKTDRSISDVLIDVGRNAQDLLRSEIQLAQSDVRDRMVGAWPAGVLFAVGSSAALLGAFFGLLAVLFALRLLMPGWAAAICVAAGLALTAALVLTAAVRRFRASPHLFRPLNASNEEAPWNRRRGAR